MRGLTEAQQQAVARRSGPLLLAAGAGSGKTSVLVERFVRAVREDGLAPSRILAITFTERAAGELRARVRERFIELGERSAARDTEAAFVSTFHGFCARLLRAHALLAGLDPDFEILDEPLALRLRERAFALALARFTGGSEPQPVELVAAFGPDRMQAMIEKVHAELRSRGQRLPRLPRLPADAAARARTHARTRVRARASAAATNVDDTPAASDAVRQLDQLLLWFTNAYEQLKRARQAVDFDDLELCALELLRRDPGCRTAWSQRFELLMVDEFQDTNGRQLEILEALERDNLFAVGDEKQAIYGFRGADVGSFRARRAALEPRAAVVELVENFRSRPPLLAAVNAAFSARFGAGHAALQAARADADGHGDGPLVELLLSAKRGWGGSPGPELGNGAEPRPAACNGQSSRRGGVALWRQEEASALAGRIAELIDAGQARAGEVVVLLRSLGDLDTYERALRRRGLRTLASAGSFWASQQVGDLLAYLRALANPLDELALYGTLASPLAGISSDALALIALAAQARGSQQVWTTIRDASQAAGGELLERLSTIDRNALAAFAERLQRERADAPMRSIAQLIERALEESGYRQQLLNLDWGERRLANVHKLLRFARRFEASEGRDLRGFVDHATRLRESPRATEPEAPLADAEQDAIRLMSIHAAKGLEFPIVCVADLGRAPNLTVPDLLVDGERVGLRLASLDGAEPAPAFEFEDLYEQRLAAEAEEEDRILYVAMTRARERLLLSAAVDFESWPKPGLRSPAISWLGPALVPGLPEAVLAHAQSGRPSGEQTLPAACPQTRIRCRLNAPEPEDSVLGERDPPVLASRTQLEAASTLAERAPRPRAPGLRPARAHPGGELPARLELRDLRHLRAARDPLGQLGSLSYTALTALERCGYRFYLERILGLPAVEAAGAPAGTQPAGGLSAADRGTLVHRLLESVDFARPQTPSPERVAALARGLGLRAGDAELQDAAALVAAATRTALGRRVAAAVSVRQEAPFAFSIGGEELMLAGVIDLLALEPDGKALVLDYKTDRLPQGSDLAAVVERDYGWQRQLYALAALRDGAPQVEVVHWFLERPDDGVSVRYAAGEADALERLLRARIRAARKNTFLISQHPHRGLCETCPGRARLCSWSDAETMREEVDCDAQLRLV